MSNHKEIFFEILKELNIPSTTRSTLSDQIYEINFDINRGQNGHKFKHWNEIGHCRVEMIVEEKWVASVKSALKEIRKKKLISTLNSKFYCKGTKI